MLIVCLVKKRRCHTYDGAVASKYPRNVASAAFKASTRKLRVCGFLRGPSDVLQGTPRAMSASPADIQLSGVLVERGHPSLVHDRTPE